MEPSNGVLSTADKR